MDQVQNMELSKDQIIQELIALLNQNQQKEAANDVFEMVTLIDGMGKRLEQVTEELSSVRKQLEKMEQDGKLQCIITSNIYELCQRSGCKNVIELHGSIYHNICQRCGREYPVEYIKQAHGIPVCEDCQIPIRPGLFFFREMVDSQLVTQAVEEINRAEVLLLLGTNLNSEVFSHYIKYFQGKYLVIIHQRSHYLDDNADMVFIDQPKNILSRLS